MLVTPPDGPPSVQQRRCRGRYAIGVGLAAMLLAVLSLAPYLGSATELVRLRNALLLAQVHADGFDWNPDTPPTDFAVERAPPDAVFVQATGALRLNALDSDWDRVLTISRHLLSHPALVGTPIQANLRETYQRILEEGTGYCGDFTRVFMAFALTAGIPVRAWSFSLDGFGGHGHIWPEVWNRQLQQWQLVDIFNNSYFAHADGVPLSALALRRALVQGDAVQLLPLAPGARPGYTDAAKAWAYYRSGLPQWYLSWGNAVFSYDQTWLARGLAPVSRSLEQAGVIAQGAYPRIHILADAVPATPAKPIPSIASVAPAPTANYAAATNLTAAPASPQFTPLALDNAPQVAALRQVRYHLLVAGAVALAGLVATIGGALGCWLVRRDDRLHKANTLHTLHKLPKRQQGRAAP